MLSTSQYCDVRWQCQLIPVINNNLTGSNPHRSHYRHPGSEGVFINGRYRGMEDSVAVDWTRLAIGRLIYILSDYDDALRE